MSEAPRGRLGGWVALVGAVAALNYASRYTIADTGGGLSPLYRYSTVAGSVFEYAVMGALTWAIARGRAGELFALRRPRSWARALGLAALVFLAILAVGRLVSALPLESPGKEQGLTPEHWNSRYAGPFAANAVPIVLLAPFVEEILFRGVGYGLLRRFGRTAAILLVGLAFGLAHGVVVGLLVLVPFGALLAWLRNRTDSVLPGMLVHATFNGLALLSVVVG